MNILRKLTISLFAFILSATLFTMAWASIGQATIHDRQTVKNWFDKSGFYNNIVDVVLDKVKNTSVGQGDALPIDDPILQSSVKQAFSPDFLKTSVNTVLDSSYAWLGGSAQNLDFTIDLTSAKQQIASGVGSYVTARVDALPPCASAIRGNNGFDGFSATCRPNGLNSADAGKLASEDFLKQDFLKEAVFNADSLKLKDTNGQEVPLTSDTKVTTLRTVYQKSGQLPIALGVLSLLLAVAIIFMSSSKLKGVRRVGYTFLTSGIVLLVTYFAIGIIFSMVQTNINQGGAGGSAQTTLVINLIKVIADSVKSVLVWYTAAYIIIGAGAFILVLVIHKKRGQNHSDDSKLPDTPHQPQATSDATPLPPREIPHPPAPKTEDFPRKKPRLIQ